MATSGIHRNKIIKQTMTHFHIEDPSLESQWRAIILFGKNTATYKFAFALSLLKMIEEEKTEITLEDLSDPYARYMVSHIKNNPSQSTSNASSFLQACHQYNTSQLTIDQLREQTLRHGFRYVIDAFQNVNGQQIPSPFFYKEFQRGKKKLIITDEMLKLKESYHYHHFAQEVDARWHLVETAWNFKLNPALLEVEADIDKDTFFIQKSLMRRIDITSVRDALNGYQKGKCFYSNKEISIISGHKDLCEVDHFLPHCNKLQHKKEGANINGVWNLVLADAKTNNEKRARIPSEEYLYKLHERNEYYIQSKHPLAETIINQTGKTTDQRRLFLQKQYNIARQYSLHKWQPKR